MTEPADGAALLLQKVGDLLFESRAIAQQLETLPEGEISSAEAGDRIAYGVLVAALENDLVKTLQEAVDVVKRFSAAAGPLGEQWLGEQQKKLGPGG